MLNVKQIVIPSNPADQKTIFAAVKEADDSLTRIEAEKDQVKAIIDDIADKFPELNKKFIRKLITTYHRQNFDKQTAESSEFVELYETIVK